MSRSDDGEDAQDFAASRPEFVFGDDEEEQEQNSTDEDVNDDTSANSRSWINVSSYPNEIDLYALLGLPRDPPPSNADIRAAYHRVSAQFHPDKHNPAQQGAARQQFERVQNAYDVLTDSKKRVIYDLLGEEGLRREYGPGGTMRHEAYGQTKEIGPKAMSTAEFRRWFINQMKKKERKELESLVESRTSLTLGLNAITVFPSRENTKTVEIRRPTVRPSRFFVRSSFKIPMPLFVGVTSTSDSPASATETDLPQDTTEDDVQSKESISGHFNIHASVGGQLQRTKRQVKVRDLETGEESLRTILLPSSLLSRSLSLGTAAFISVPDTFGRDINGNIISKGMRNLVNGAEIEIGTQLLPQPSASLTFARAFTPLESAMPFILRAQAVCNQVPQKLPPMVSFTLSRQIGLRQTIFCSWSSGTLFWPSLLQTLLGQDDEEPVMMSLESSAFSFGLNGFSAPSPPRVSGDHPVERKTPSGASWGLEVGASPAGGSLSLVYGRNVFRGQVPTPKLSEWGSEERQNTTEEATDVGQVNAVRLEVQTTITLDGSLSWSVRGNRKFGDFTRAGLSVALQGARGLVLSFTWSRLGQNISVPVVVCPLALVEADIAAAAVSIPWLAYSVLHYGLLKPKAAKRRKEMLKRQKEELERAIVGQRQESLEAVELLKPTVERKQQREERQGGLVIVEAQYGVPKRSSRKPSKVNDSSFADVTIPTAALVHHGQLSLSKSVNKTQLIGFYDPAPMKEKVLRVRYIFGGREHYAEFSEDQDVICPSRQHQMSL